MCTDQDRLRSCTSTLNGREIGKHWATYLAPDQRKGRVRARFGMGLGGCLTARAAEQSRDRKESNSLQDLMRRSTARSRRPRRCAAP
jgi:hypothetical protein